MGLSLRNSSSVDGEKGGSKASKGKILRGAFNHQKLVSRRGHVIKRGHLEEEPCPGKNLRRQVKGSANRKYFPKLRVEWEKITGGGKVSWAITIH